MANTMRYTVMDGTYSHEYETASPREAAEAMLDGYDWREDLTEEYGSPEGFSGEVQDASGRTVATFRATPEGIVEFNAW